MRSGSLLWRPTILIYFPSKVYDGLVTTRYVQIIDLARRNGNRAKRRVSTLLFALFTAPQFGNNGSNLSRVLRAADWVRTQRYRRSGAFIITSTGVRS